MVITPFCNVALVTAGPTLPETNTGVIRVPGKALITPPRVRLADTETRAGWLNCSAQRVPDGPGLAPATVGSHKPPNSRVTPLEFKPGRVSPGLSVTSANGA